MFPTNETENKPNTGQSTVLRIEQKFDSVEQFAKWLDADLDVLVSKYAEFETDKSVRNFFKRS